MPGLGNPILRETGSPLLSVSGGSQGVGQGRWAGAGHPGNWTTLTFRVRAHPDPEPELAAGSGPFPQSRDHTEAQRVRRWPLSPHHPQLGALPASGSSSPSWFPGSSVAGPWHRGSYEGPRLCWGLSLGEGPEQGYSWGLLTSPWAGGQNLGLTDRGQGPLLQLRPDALRPPGKAMAGGQRVLGRTLEREREEPLSSQGTPCAL